jgi:hypothetical protein
MSLVPLLILWLIRFEAVDSDTRNFVPFRIAHVEQWDFSSLLILWLTASFRVFSDTRNSGRFPFKAVD